MYRFALLGNAALSNIDRCQKLMTGLGLQQVGDEGLEPPTFTV